MIAPPRVEVAESVTLPKSAGHRLLLARAGRHPASVLAVRLGVPERTFRRWIAGARPVWRHRRTLESAWGIPIMAWYEEAR